MIEIGATRKSGRGNHSPRRALHPAVSYRLTPEEWPPHDREAWKLACRRGGPLQRPGTAADLAPATRKIREWAYGRMLSFLTCTENLRIDEPVEARLTKSLLGAYILSMRSRLSAHSIHNQLVNLSLVFQAMCPDRNWHWIRTHIDAPTAKEIRASKKSINDVDPKKLLHAAMAYCDESSNIKGPIKRALQYRDGVILIILIEHAMRLKNLSEMKIGEHLLIEKKHYYINFETTVKNNEVIDGIVAEIAAEYLEKYLEVHRPVLLRRKNDHGALWVNIDGDPLNYTTIGQRICIVSRRLGQRMSPHDARYALATHTMTIDPRNIGLAAAALAHRGNRSVNRVYDQSGSLASQAYWMALFQRTSR